MKRDQPQNGQERGILLKMTPRVAATIVDTRSEFAGDILPLANHHYAAAANDPGSRETNIEES
jgi:hypothetical protein